jgi:hypothetical protein
MRFSDEIDSHAPLKQINTFTQSCDVATCFNHVKHHMISKYYSTNKELILGTHTIRL